MPRGRHSAIAITLSVADEAQCRHWSRQTTIPVQQARAAAIILARAGGMRITDIAAQVGMSRRHVYDWLQRFQAQGVAGLLRKPWTRRTAA
jgi:CRP-like cAMP-binding protein